MAFKAPSLFVVLLACARGVVGARTKLDVHAVTLASEGGNSTEHGTQAEKGETSRASSDTLASEGGNSTEHGTQAEKGETSRASSEVHSHGGGGSHKDKSCFPAGASVETPAGPKLMSQLRVGDRVLSVDGSGQTFFDEVYFFGHADRVRANVYVDLELAGQENMLHISQKHFIPVCPEHGQPCEWAQQVHKYAQAVEVGDYVWATAPAYVWATAPADGNVGGKRVGLRMVQNVSTVIREGLYNPYTLSGTIVVNGVAASAHSDWVLDPWVPASWAHHLPRVYQALFLPGRWLYRVAGPAAADALDVNNPQLVPEKHGNGPEFLAAVAALPAACMLLLLAKRLM